MEDNHYLGLSLFAPRHFYKARPETDSTCHKMPKRNFGLLDVIAAVRDINRVGVGYRVANLYDIDLKTATYLNFRKKDVP